MKESYYTLLEEVMQIQHDDIEKIQWMLKTVHDFSQEDPLFVEDILAPLVILHTLDLEKSETLLEKIRYDQQKIEEILACLKEKGKKEKKYFYSKVLSDLLILWEFTRLGKRMSGKNNEELHTLLDTFGIKHEYK